MLKYLDIKLLGCMSTDTQYKFRIVNLYKINTQLTQFALSGAESESTLSLDSQYDPILIDSPQVVSSIAMVRSRMVRTRVQGCTWSRVW
jgi:hypothetical protein